jgi:hypothetical protein
MYLCSPAKEGSNLGCIAPVLARKDFRLIVSCNFAKQGFLYLGSIARTVLFLLEFGVGPRIGGSESAAITLFFYSGSCVNRLSILSISAVLPFLASRDCLAGTFR